MRYKQLELFLEFALLGAASGLVYDWLRAFRRSISHKCWVVILEDVVFCAAWMCSFYGLCYWGDLGRIRIYSWLGEAAGLLVYLWLLSPWMLRLFGCIWKILGLPFRSLKRWIRHGENR